MLKIKIKKSRFLTFILLFFLTPLSFSLAMAAFNDIYLPIVYYDADPTATPTSTPTATPPPEQPEVYVLNNHISYVDDEDYLHVLGEVENDTGNDLRYVEIDANFYDQNGDLLYTEYTYTLLDNLPAYDKTCFELLLPVPPGWSTYDFEDPSYWTDGNPLPELTIVYDGGIYDPYFGRYKINGQIRNDDSSRIEYVSPVGTLYDAYGAVIGCNFTFINSLHLDPGQMSSFELTFSGRDYSDADAYRLQVQGKSR